MMHLDVFDLSNDADAHQYVKHEVVSVVFAANQGCIESLEGPNHYVPSDALITSHTGAQWVVSRHRFDEKYEAITPLVHGQNGAYQSKPIPVWAKQMQEPFTTTRRAGGDRLQGMAGDWLMQYGAGDYGITQQARFSAVYQRVK